MELALRTVALHPLTENAIEEAAAKGAKSRRCVCVDLKVVRRMRLLYSA